MLHIWCLTNQPLLKGDSFDLFWDKRHKNLFGRKSYKSKQKFFTLGNILVDLQLVKANFVEANLSAKAFQS